MVIVGGVLHFAVLFDGNNAFGMDGPAIWCEVAAGADGGVLVRGKVMSSLMVMTLPALRAAARDGGADRGLAVARRGLARRASARCSPPSGVAVAERGAGAGRHARQPQPAGGGRHRSGLRRRSDARSLHGRAGPGVAARRGGDPAWPRPRRWSLATAVALAAPLVGALVLLGRHRGRARHGCAASRSSSCRRSPRPADDASRRGGGGLSRCRVDRTSASVGRASAPARGRRRAPAPRCPATTAQPFTRTDRSRVVGNGGIDRADCRGCAPPLALLVPA